MMGIGMAVRPPRSRGPVLMMVSALRRLGGTLFYAPDNALGDGAPNLFTSPEDFESAAWTKLGVAQVTGGVSDPFGETNARRLSASAGGLSYFLRSVSVAAGDVSFSAHLKAGNASWAALWFNGIGVGAYINLSTGQLGTVSAGVSAHVVSNTGGWIRVNVSRTASAGDQDFAVFAAKGNGNATVASGDYIDVFGAKLELGSVATAYTPQSVLRQRGVYVDNVGTTPVTAVADLIGLITDKSYGGQLGVNVFADATVVFGGESTRVSPGVYRVYSSAGVYSSVSVGAGLTPYKTYKLKFFQDTATAGTLAVDGPAGAVTSFPSGVGERECIITMTATTTVSIKRVSGVTDIQISNLLLREVPGNHATQSAVASKPSLQRVNGRNVISFDGNNDFLQTGITTGNEGWVCTGVTFGGAAGANETVACSGAGASTQKGVWLRRAGVSHGENAFVAGVCDGSTLYQAVVNSIPLRGFAHVVEGGWTTSSVYAAVDGVSNTVSKTGDATPPAATLDIGRYISGAHYMQGPMHAFAYTPVLPSAADRKTIRNGIAALQGRTL